MRPHLKSVGFAIILVGSTSIALSPTLTLRSFASVRPRTMQEWRAEGARLLQIAKQHYRRVEFRQAITLYQQVLAQPEAASSAKIEALYQLGDIAFWAGQIPEAESKLQQALKLAQDNHDRQSEGRTLAWLAAVRRYRQDYGQALSALKTALAINQETHDRKGEARSQLQIGIVFFFQSKYLQALEMFQQALRLDRAIDDRDDIAHLYDWIAITYIQLKDFKQAESYIQQQILSRAIGYRLAEYAGLNTLASLQRQQKQTEQMLQTYQKQLEIARTADNPWFQRAALVRIGSTYIDRKQLPQGLEFLQKALAVARTLDRESVAEVQNSIGPAYNSVGQYPQALEAFQAAENIAHNIPNRTTELQAILARGQTYIAQGQSLERAAAYEEAIAALTKALESFQQGLTLARELKNTQLEQNAIEGIWISYSGRGLALQNQRRYGEAIATYQQLLAFWQQNRDRLPVDMFLQQELANGHSCWHGSDSSKNLKLR
jgi:tetratricopeptide (TPR) repeat protein